MDINKIQEEIFSLIPDALAEIPEDFNFKENLAIEIKIGENIIDNNYSNDIDLEVQVTGLLENKFNVQAHALELNEKLDNYKFINVFARIIHENVWYSSFKDKEKFTSVLMYKIRSYKER
ncbi:hypothetical protein [Clostridium perfringens]|uniref:hypothetical protein n=1 Tax=Clostridium perfringens TaxID=1502 RepID=UPI00096A8157|nr:hypothetical protein [Clostridium perfringens]MDM0458200.1 hypothetical protein [Clostridium perfringens]MDM0973222.1 hypothetical protein [Clostridium perfringens]